MVTGEQTYKLDGALAKLSDTDYAATVVNPLTLLIFADKHGVYLTLPEARTYSWEEMSEVSGEYNRS